MPFHIYIPKSLQRRFERYHYDHVLLFCEQEAPIPGFSEALRYRHYLDRIRVLSADAVLLYSLKGLLLRSRGNSRRPSSTMSFHYWSGNLSAYIMMRD